VAGLLPLSSARATTTTFAASSRRRLGALERVRAVALDRHHDVKDLLRLRAAPQAQAQPVRRLVPVRRADALGGLDGEERVGRQGVGAGGERLDGIGGRVVDRRVGDALARGLWREGKRGRRERES